MSSKGFQDLAEGPQEVRADVVITGRKHHPIEFELGSARLVRPLLPRLLQ